MDDAVMIAVEVPLVGGDRQKHWAKLVTSVDVTKASGWAFEGEFIADGGVQDVPEGSVLLVYGERGSRANPRPEARVYVAIADGTLSQRGEAKGRAWARTLRDTVERLLEDAAAAPLPAHEWDPQLMRYSDAALHEELERRRRRGT